jgi:hypothetical protein
MLGANPPHAVQVLVVAGAAVAQLVEARVVEDQGPAAAVGLDREVARAAAAAIAISACVPGGVQTSTMSMSSRPTRARQSVVCWPTP